MKKILFLVAVAIVMNVGATDVMLPSFSHPGDLPLDSIPQFICFGFDDNVYLDGLKWVDSLFMSKKNPDGSQVLASFYIISHPEIENQELWDYIDTVFLHGHEIGNHTQHHDAEKFNAEMNSYTLWDAEIGGANADLERQSHIPQSAIEGFRTPFLGYSDATFEAMAAHGIKYDCSIEHFSTQYQTADGNWAVGLVWPYTLENGVHKSAFKQDAPSAKPGMWELPVYEFQKTDGSWQGVTGFDWNLWFKGFKKEDVITLWKSSLTFRMEGYAAHDVIPNRAPFLVGVHSDEYTDDNEANATASDNTANRRAALDEFIDWALQYSPAVRIVPYRAVIEWMKNPVPYSQYHYEPNNGVDLIGKNVSVAKSVPSISFISSGKNGLVIKSGISGILSLRIYSLNGKIVSNIENVKISDGVTGVKFPKTLSPGNYVVKTSGIFNKSAYITVMTD